MGDNGPYFLFYAVAAVFVASALIGRRIPLGKAAWMVLAWIGIFAAAIAIFSFRNDFLHAGRRMLAEATGSPVVEGGVVRIPISEDGHFWVNAIVNGKTIRFLVDSGATMTTIGRDEATKAEIEISPTGRLFVRTGNGLVRVSSGSAQSLRVGSIERHDFQLHVADNEDLNVLGMNFLSTLPRWGVEDHWLVLIP